MGDPLRFRLFADLIETRFHRFKDSPVADVAGGKGHLKAALYLRGWRHVTTIDARHRLAKGRPGQHYAKFTMHAWQHYSLVIGMHPDEATDHIILYAAKHLIPFAVCPCCIKPSAINFDGRQTKASWIEHLVKLAMTTHTVSRDYLPMEGDSLILLGLPR